MAALIVDFPSGSVARATVAFDDEVDIKFIENLSYKHRGEMWFTEQEMKFFKYNTAMLLRQIQSSMDSMAQFAELNITNTAAFMGLENYLTDSGGKPTARRRREVRRAVLTEQQRQDELGIDDPLAIARVAEAQTAVSRKRAHIIAMMHTEKRAYEGAKWWQSGSRIDYEQM